MYIVYFIYHFSFYFIRFTACIYELSLDYYAGDLYVFKYVQGELINDIYSHTNKRVFLS